MQNKLSIFILLGLVTLVSTMGFLYMRQKPLDSNIIPDAIEHNQNDLNSLKIYRDLMHHYHISYPGYLTPIVDDTTTHQGVTFVAEGDSWTIAVSVSTTTAISARMWIEEYNQRNYTGSPPYTTRYRIEQEMAM